MRISLASREYRRGGGAAHGGGGKGRPHRRSALLDELALNGTAVADAERRVACCPHHLRCVTSRGPLRAGVAACAQTTQRCRVCAESVRTERSLHFGRLPERASE